MCFDKLIASNKLQFFVIMLNEKFMVSALSRVKTIELFGWCHDNVRNSVIIARVRNSGSHFQSNLFTFAGDLDFVLNSESPYILAGVITCETSTAFFPRIW